MRENINLPILRVPNEVMRMIVHLLSAGDLARLQQTCRDFRTILIPEFWTHIHFDVELDDTFMPPYKGADDKIDDPIESVLTPYVGSYICKCAKGIFLTDHCCEKVTMVFKDWNFREFAKAILDGRCQEVLKYIRCVSINSRYYFPPSSLVPHTGSEVDDLRDHVVFNWFMKHAIPAMPNLERVDIQTKVGGDSVDSELAKQGNPIVCELVTRLKETIEVNYDLELAREWERFNDRVAFKNTKILTITISDDDADFRNTRLFCGLSLPDTIERLVITDRTEDKPPPTILPARLPLQRTVAQVPRRRNEFLQEQVMGQQVDQQFVDQEVVDPAEGEEEEEEQEEEENQEFSDEEEEDGFDEPQIIRNNLIIPPHVFHDLNASRNQIEEDSRGIPANDLRDFLAPCTKLRAMTVYAPVVNRDQINWLPPSVTDFVMDDSSISIGPPQYEAPNVSSFQATISSLGSECTLRYFRFNSLKRLFLNFYIGSPESWFGPMVAQELLSHNPGLVQLRTQNLPYDVIAALVRNAPNLQSLIVHSPSKPSTPQLEQANPDDPGQCYAHLSAIARGAPQLRFLALDALCIANYHQFVDCIGAFLVHCSALRQLYLHTTDCDIGNYWSVPQGMLFDDSSVIMFPGIKQLDIARFRTKYRFRDDSANNNKTRPQSPVLSNGAPR